MERISIKKASKNDIPVILGLLYELGRPKPQKDKDVDVFRKIAKKYISDSDKQILIAINNDVEIVGMASIVFLSRLNQTNHEMYIPELIVTKEFQSKGVGKKLIESCIKLGKEKKCHRIRLESGNQRTESHEFYKKLGFEQSSLSFSKNLSNVNKN